MAQLFSLGVICHMRSIAIFCLSILLLAEGCSTHSQCRRDLYQSSFKGAADATITINLLDRQESHKAHDYAVGALALRLEELHTLAKDADKDDLERQADLAHAILQHATEHREQLLQDEWSLQMVIELKSLVTNTVDIKRASELAQYLAASSTNQLRFPTP